MNPSHVFAVKRAISTYAPALFSAIRYGRGVAHRRRNIRLQSKLTPWKEAFVRKFGSVVQGGPFAGMIFHYHDDIEPAFVICPSCVGLPMFVRDVEPHWSMAKIDFTYECSDCGAEIRQTVVKPQLQH